MKYTELTKIRAFELYKEGILNGEEYNGKLTHYTDSSIHVCWFSVCVSDRNNWWKCEVCGNWDEERRPYE